MELNLLKIKFHLCRVNNSSLLIYLLSIANTHKANNISLNIDRIEFKCRNRKK